MQVREFRSEDMNLIHEMYQKFYKDYEYYRFGEDFQFACSVLDGNDLIAAGGIKPVIELAAVINKNISARKRREAMLHVLQTSIYAANRAGFNQLHVFSHDDDWTRKLISAGFEPRGSVLTLDV